METLTKTQQGYIEQWTSYRYAPNTAPWMGGPSGWNIPGWKDVLKIISPDDLDVVLANVKWDFGWSEIISNDRVHCHQYIMTYANNEQMNVFLKHDTLHKIPVSDNSNELLFRAISADDVGLMKMVVSHPLFEYGYDKKRRRSIHHYKHSCPFMRFLKEHIHKKQKNSKKIITETLERVEKFVCLLDSKNIRFAARSIYPYYQIFGDVPEYECDCQFAKQIQRYVQSQR